MTVFWIICLPVLNPSIPKRFRHLSPVQVPLVTLITLLSFRDEEAKAASTSGHQETAVAMTTATATATPQACGRSPSTRPSMTDARPCTTRAAPPPWRPRSAMGARGTQRPASWVHASISSWIHARRFIAFSLVCLQLFLESTGLKIASFQRAACYCISGNSRGAERKVFGCNCRAVLKNGGSDWGTALLYVIAFLDIGHVAVGSHASSVL